MTYLKKIRSFNKEQKIKTVVIDDDPTGCQTVYSVPLLTSWDRNKIAKALEYHDVIFILTNSRSLKAEEAVEINREVAVNLKHTLKKNWKLRVISRSDSTLRGYLKEEVFTLMETIGPFDGVIIAPFFAEGGRVTFNDTHFIYQNGNYIPVAETEFARDPVFGYPVSNLPEWLEFKSKGYWKKESVISVTIDDIRTKGPERIAEKLMKAGSARAIILNALNYEDLECAVWAICLAEKQGKQFLYRTAASFVRIRAGISRKKLVNPTDKAKNSLIIAGSYVQKTTKQIEELCKYTKVLKAEILIGRIHNEKERYMDELIKLVDEGLASGKNVLLSTQRDYISFGSNDETQAKTREISLFVSGIVAGLKTYPGVIIAKGGITSHAVAKHGLGIEQAEVLGQIEPGVPVLRLSPGSKAAGSYFVIFPGNVGEPDTLQRIVEKLSKVQSIRN